MKEKASLFLIPTPIGNLEDITLRALRILREVDIVLAEDTRQSLNLLRHFQIHAKLQSYHAFNEHRSIDGLIRIIREGKKIGLVTDAGTPGISDPGYLIVKACIENNIVVECLPGPVAFIPALINSGLPTDSFTFLGFPPVKKGRKTFFEAISNESRTMVFYESPHKLLKTLNDMRTYFGAGRLASVSRELTKIYEETKRGKIIDILEYYSKGPVKGEFVIVVEGKNSGKKDLNTPVNGNSED